MVAVETLIGTNPNEWRFLVQWGHGFGAVETNAVSIG